MSLEAAFDRFKSLNQTIGKRALNALFPNDVELYVNGAGAENVPVFDMDIGYPILSNKF